MTIIRTSLNLSKYNARRLVRDGYEIAYVETFHRETGDESSIVWTRPTRTDDIPEHEIPF